MFSEIHVPVFVLHDICFCDDTQHHIKSNKAMLIKESVLRPEIFQILSASQAKKHTQKKNHRTT